MDIIFDEIEVNFLQPEYYDEFKCDGQKCNAACCKGWTIKIDDKSVVKYQQIESQDKEITSNLIFSVEYNQHIIALHKNGDCPFLNDKNLCKIQCKYGEDFLSKTCSTYPRITSKIEDVPVIERALTLSCPVAAELVLLSALPIQFKMVKESNVDILSLVDKYNPPEEITTYAEQIRMMAIQILQKRDLNIDQRLAVAGVFLDIISETIKAEKFDDVPQILEMYESDGIIYESLQSVWQDANFDYKKFIKFMLGDIMEVLFCKDSKDSAVAKGMFGAFKAFLKIDSENLDDASLENAVKKFKELEPLHQKFSEHFSIIFENWLVNEFFINHYPWSFETSIPNNFGVFVATYKIVELMAFIDSMAKNALKQKSLLDIINYMARYLNHNPKFIKKISDEIGEEMNIPQLVSSLLKTRNF